MDDFKAITAGVKSVRLEQHIAEAIPDTVNFSNYVNRMLEEQQRKAVWIPNTRIEEYAKIPFNIMWDRMQQIQYFRTNYGALRFTLYPTSEEEILMNKRVHAYAQGDFNRAHDGFVYFNVEFPINLYLFLASREWTDVEKFYQSFLTFTYWNSDENDKGIMESQLEKSTLKTMIKTLSSDHFKELDRLQREFHKRKSGQFRAAFNNAYFKALAKFGIDPIMFSFTPSILEPIFYPFPLLRHIKRESETFDIKLKTAYMRDLYDDTDDWESLIIKGNVRHDDLQRAESQKKPLTLWKMCYRSYHEYDFDLLESNSKASNRKR